VDRSYSFAIEDLEDEGPKPAIKERRRARQLALVGRYRQLRVVVSAMLEYDATAMSRVANVATLAPSSGRP
jgi:hypothetical protein